MDWVRYQAPAVACAILIFGLSSIPGTTLQSYPFVSFDKLLHILEFGVFGYLLALALERNTATWVREHWLSIAIIVGILYGVADEWHQGFVPGRTAAAADAVADGIGVFAAQLLYRWHMMRRKASMGGASNG